MTVTLNLTDEQARRLEARAARHGQDLAAYLLSLAERETLSEDARQDLVDELTHLIPDDVPPLSEEALHRDTMYRE
jgi:hypothetical protein